jgi:hypothetical protein
MPLCGIVVLGYPRLMIGVPTVGCQWHTYHQRSLLVANVWASTGNIGGRQWSRQSHFPIPMSCFGCKLLGGGGGGLGLLWLAGAGGEEGGGGAAAGRRGARRPPHPSGSGPGLTCTLSNAIEIVQPCSQSDSLHNMQNTCRIGKNMQNNMRNMSQNMQNMQTICSRYIEYAEYTIKYVQ